MKAFDAPIIHDFEARLTLLELYWQTFLANHIRLAPGEIELNDHTYFKADPFNATQGAQRTTEVWLLAQIEGKKPPEFDPAAPVVAQGAAPASAQVSVERVKFPLLVFGR